MTPVPFGQCAVFHVPISGLDGETPPVAQSLGSLNVTVDDYTNFFAALDAYGHVAVYARAGVLPQGSSKPVNATFNGTSLNGTALPAVAFGFEFSGPPAPPQAVVINVPTPVIQPPSGGFVPPDPGSATIDVPHS